MQKFIVLGLLGLCSLEDLKQKKLTVMYLFLFGIAGVVLHLWFPMCSIYSILWGMALGAAMLLVSLITEGGVGLGDGLLLMVTGVYLGGYRNLELFMVGMFLAAIWSLGLLALKRKKRKEEIAFVPFLLLSYLVMLFQGV